ncbi:unnamed protein product [Schistosoma mattheei]|uniref:Phosducin domain-containing protein n=1 Tax=Schistosoma mattheei TaxID=31246 RepID=A0A183PYW9_9TREM|nr:unnamed protein product [Schistosoma mattheei]
MLDPNEDTEWNDILRQKGILPPKKIEPEEELPLPPDPKSILDKLTSDELDEKLDLLEDGEIDGEEARFLEEYRRKRIAMMQEVASKSRFGNVREVTKADWTTEVTNAGDTFVVIHVGEKGHGLCSLIDQHFRKLAQKFPTVKFLRGEASLCIPNYPTSNLPSILIYKSGDLKEQLIGPKAVGGNTVTLKGNCLWVHLFIYFLWLLVTFVSVVLSLISYQIIKTFQSIQLNSLTFYSFIHCSTNDIKTIHYKVV